MLPFNYASPSQICTFIECPRKWYVTYRLKLYPYKDTVHTQLGNILHKAVEFAAKSKIINKPEKFHDPLSYLNILTESREISNDTRKALSINDILKELPNSNLLTDAEKTLLPIMCKVVNNLGWIKTCNASHTKIEKDFTFKINDVKIVGKIDRIDEFSDYVNIYDLKTSKQPYSDEDIKNNWQAKLYAIEPLKNNKMVNFEFWFVRQMDGIKKIIFEPDDLKSILYDLNIILEKMKRESGGCYKTSGLCPFCPHYITCQKERN